MPLLSHVEAVPESVKARRVGQVGRKHEGRRPRCTRRAPVPGRPVDDLARNHAVWGGGRCAHGIGSFDGECSEARKSPAVVKLATVRSSRSLRAVPGTRLGNQRESDRMSYAGCHPEGEDGWSSPMLSVRRSGRQMEPSEITETTGIEGLIPGMYSVSVENTVARQPFTYNQTDGDGRERVHGLCIGFLHYFAVSLCATESLYHGHAVRKYRAIRSRTAVWRLF